MAKTILIFSDGTGQLGGLRPDQRLSNVYKMYRAMRPGPDSPIDPSQQVAFYDAGLGVGETGGFTFRRVRNALEAAVGSGIDENVIDCYAAVIARYEPGDRICLIGFSRGAYTVRALANVMNLCGVPTRSADGSLVPRAGAPLRAIAARAVRRVYNHGAGHERGAFEEQREALAGRFRLDYGSQGVGADGEPQGNVQPHFVGVFDTVAALGSKTATTAAFGVLALLWLAAVCLWRGAPWWVAIPFASVPWAASYWAVRSFAGQIKFWLDDLNAARSRWDPRRWAHAVSNGHVAWWSGRNYDRYIDREVGWARHALAIDEDRARFPRVEWGDKAAIDWNAERGKRHWLVQVWFAGNHSDIGGSYPEEESRLSDIALAWMVDELQACLAGDLRIMEERLRTWPDPLALQHSEREPRLEAQPRWFRRLTGDRVTWSRGVRKIDPKARLHPTVFERLTAPQVPQGGRVAPYRPPALARHVAASAIVRPPTATARSSETVAASPPGTPPRDGEEAR